MPLRKTGTLENQDGYFPLFFEVWLSWCFRRTLPAAWNRDKRSPPDSEALRLVQSHPALRSGVFSCLLRPRTALHGIRGLSLRFFLDKIMNEYSIIAVISMPKVQVETRVVDTVHAFKGRYKRYGYPARFCLYYVDGLLIDTGPPHARRTIFDWLENKTLERIVLTHFHEDHSGNAREVSRRFDVPVLMGEKTADILADPPRLPLYRKVVWGQMDRVVGQELPDPLETAGHRFRVVSTPGHSHDHVAFIEEDKGWLFAGDLFLSNRLNYGMRGESVPQLIDSLRRVLEYPVQILFCGHSGVITDGRSALERKLRFLEWLQEETYHLADRGLTPREISRRLLSGGKMMEWVTLGEFSSVHLIRSIMEGRG